MSIRQTVIDLVAEAVALGARRKQACALLGITSRTLQRWHQPEGLVDKRQIRQYTPANKLSDDERHQVLAVSNSDLYAHLAPCQIVPRLADCGQYLASESTFYRILREEGLLRHRSRSRPKTHHKPKELVATAPNQVWSWDATYLPTTVRGIFYYLYLVMDIFSRKIVGWTVQPLESSEQASWLMQDICDAEGISKDQVILHSDNGAMMKGAVLLATLQKLGVTTSFSRPAVSNDNPYSESLFKTLKYCQIYPAKPFDSIGQSRAWVGKFVHWYNKEHYHSALKFMTPTQRHQGGSAKISMQRENVYQLAKKLHPERWSKNIKNWHLPKKVVLNPSGKTDLAIKDKESPAMIELQKAHWQLGHTSLPTAQQDAKSRRQLC